jgi:hypothetical protein
MRVVERPVEQQVTLAEEHARVEPRPVDRPVTEADLGTFKEGTIEVTERAEVAVVKRTARVVEEVEVGKQRTESTESTHETVRETEVDVQHTPAEGSAAARPAGESPPVGAYRRRQRGGAGLPAPFSMTRPRRPPGRRLRPGACGP